MFSFTLVLVALSTPVLAASKRGLAWPYYNAPLNPATVKGGSVVAIYDWETSRPATANGNIQGLEFIGTQRDMDAESSPIGELTKRAAEQGWNTVFTLNEPDNKGISPVDAASWYSTYISPMTIQKALPAVTSSTKNGQGLAWLDAFLAACGNRCPHKYVNLHWYGPSFTEFQGYIEGAHTKYPNARFVITEFALENPPGGQDAQVAFFKEAFDFLDNKAEYVDLYFPFLASSPKLFSDNDGPGAAHVGTGSCMFNDDGTASKVGQLVMGKA